MGRCSLSRRAEVAARAAHQISAGNYTRGGESMNVASGLGSATTLTLEDADAIGGVAGVEHVSPGVRNRGWVKSAHRQFFTPLRGASPALAEIHGWEWLGGRFENAGDRAVMGRAAARELFGEGFDPVGEQITIGDRAFTVSGYFRTSDRDMDETVFVSLPAAQAMWKVRHLQTITVAVAQAGDASRIAEAITVLLRDRHARGQRAATTTGLGGNQLPGVANANVDDFTVKTQAAANVTKGLYTSVAAFALANMPKLDEVTLQEMLATFGLQEVLPHCVLAHIDVQAEVESQWPGSTALWFQSIAGSDTANATFDLVLAAEVLYDRAAFPRIAQAIADRLAPNGTALLTDGHRIDTRAFPGELRARGLVVTTTEHVVREEGFPVTISLLAITRAS